MSSGWQVECPWFIVNREFVYDCRARLIEPDYVDLSAVPPKLEDDLIQSSDGGQVPKMGAGNINRHLSQNLAEIKGIAERVRRDEEKLPFNCILTPSWRGASFAMRA